MNDLINKLMDKQFLAGLIKAELDNREETIKEMMEIEIPTDKEEALKLLEDNREEAQEYRSYHDQNQWASFPDLAADDSEEWFNLYQAEISAASADESRPAGWAVDVTNYILHKLMEQE